MLASASTVLSIVVLASGAVLAGPATAAVPAPIPGVVASPTDGVILFEDDREGPGGDGIWIMNADGTDARRLVRGHVNGASLSPEGTRLAFVDYVSGALRVRPLDDRGKGERVSSKRVDAYEASWSSDGTRLVYTADPTRGSTQKELQIRVTDLTDGTTTVLANERGRGEVAPVWSPNGTEIVFSAESARGCDEGPFVTYFSDLFVISASGGDERRIQVPGADLSLVPVDWHDKQLMIHATRYVDATGDPADPCPEVGVEYTAFTMRKDGSDRIERPRAGSFSPNGKWIAYTVGGMVVESIWVSRLDGSDDRLVRETAQNPYWAEALP